MCYQEKKRLKGEEKLIVDGAGGVSCYRDCPTLRARSAKQQAPISENLQPH